jgi:hypothetical protein
VSEKYEGESLLPANSVRYTRKTGAPKSPSTGSLLRLANLFCPGLLRVSTQSSRKRMINTTITIAPINRSAR